MLVNMERPNRLKRNRRTISRPNKKRRVAGHKQPEGSTVSACKPTFNILDLPRGVMDLVIDKLLGKEGPGFITAEQALSIARLAGTCRTLRNVCSESMAKLYVRFTYTFKTESSCGAPQPFLKAVLKVARRSLSKLEINCIHDTRKYRQWYTDIAPLCPNLEELHISALMPPADGGTSYFTSYKDLLEVVGKRLKVFQNFKTVNQWNVESLKQLILLCPNLKRLFLADCASVLDAEKTSLLCKAYGANMLELGLCFYATSSPDCARLIQKEFKKLKFLHINENVEFPTIGRRVCLAFDCYEAYFKALSITAKGDGITSDTDDNDENQCCDSSSVRHIFVNTYLDTPDTIPRLIRNAGHHLLYMNLPYAYPIGNDILRLMSRKLQNVRGIDLGYQDLLTDDTLDAFLRAVGANLKYLKIAGGWSHKLESYGKFTALVLRSVVKYCVNLNILNIAGFPELSDDDVKVVARGLGQRLRILCLNPTSKLTSASVQSLAQHCSSIHIALNDYLPTSRDLKRFATLVRKALRTCSYSPFDKYLQLYYLTQPWRIEQLLTGSCCELTCAGNLLCDVPLPGTYPVSKRKGRKKVRSRRSRKMAPTQK